jgi:Zn ribbon nucleic-acid-binding protein
VLFGGLLTCPATIYNCSETKTHPDDPKDHLGPFNYQQTWPENNLVAEQCLACGNTVMRGLKEDEKNGRPGEDAIKTRAPKQNQTV